jgi:hypothetical protein
VGDPRENVPGKTIVIPERLEQVRGMVQDMDKLRLSYLKNAAKALPVDQWAEGDYAFIAADLKQDVAWVKEAVERI